MSAIVVDKLVETLLVHTAVFLWKLINGVLKLWVERGLVGNPVAGHGNRRDSVTGKKSNKVYLYIIFPNVWY